jgi:hypothetical protein
VTLHALLACNNGKLSSRRCRPVCFAGPHTQPGPRTAEAHQQLALLEPLLPGPMAEGVRASAAMAGQVPPDALRRSVEGAWAALRSGASASLDGLPAGDDAAAPGAQRQLRSSLDVSWGDQGRHGPLWGLKKLLGKHQ